MKPLQNSLLSNAAPVCDPRVSGKSMPSRWSGFPVVLKSGDAMTAIRNFISPSANFLDYPDQEQISIVSKRPLFPCQSLRVVAMIAFGFLCQIHGLHAQPPALLWRTNIGANLFAVDQQTNIYANAGGTVIKLNGDGVPLQTNAICPLPGAAQRDAAGNFFFAGSFDGTQDFGGITLVGGWVNWPTAGKWTPGYPTCYLAKYGAGGNLLWVVSFGRQGALNRFHDVAVSADGPVLVGYDDSLLTPKLCLFSSTGSNLWQRTWTDTMGQCKTVKVGKFVGDTGSFIEFNNMGWFRGGFCDAAGNLTWFGGFNFNSELSTNGKPVVGVSSDAYYAGLSPFYIPYQPLFQKSLAGGGVVWTQAIGSVEQWILTEDNGGNFFLAGTNGLFSKYDHNGTLIWSDQYDSPVISMLVDSPGNRFINFSDGSFARVAADAAPQAPTNSIGPQSQTVFVGSNVVFSVAVDGTPPLRYFWRMNGTNMPAETNAALNLTSVAAGQSGAYSLVVTNVAGSITSAPAVLRVKSVELYVGGTLLTNGTYTFASPPTFLIRSAFANGSSFYTLDGSGPFFSSTYYSKPFVLSQSATVRAIGYSADFNQSEEADTVDAVVLVNHVLTASGSGGGSVNLNPPGGTYFQTNVVTATAVPDSGWMFLYWLGDTSGINSTANISMERNKSIYAVFGTTLSTTVAGSGQILLSPPGSLYACGRTVRLTAVPQPGSYFGFWGDAATGNTNPLYFAVTNPNPTISSIFGTNSANQAALTVLINGNGRVILSPQGNVFSTNQTVTLTGTPDSGENFKNWSGDATGVQNPLNLSMNQSKVVTANFTGGPSLEIKTPQGDGFGPAGFRFTLSSDPDSIYEILASTNLINWQSLGRLTNAFGETQVTDISATNSTHKFYKALP